MVLSWTREPAEGEYFERQPAGPRQPAAPSPAARERAEARLGRDNVEAGKLWRDWIARDPEGARLELRIAKAARILATSHPDSPDYARARLEYERAGAQRVELMIARARA